jgi:MFS family permease
MVGNDHTHHDHTHVDHTVPVRTGGGSLRTDGASATRGTARDAVVAQRVRFGGLKWGAAFFGWLSANGLAVILIALLSAAGLALGLARGVDTADEAVNQVDTVGLGSAIAVLVALFLAYLAGGYVAGRMARFDGARQGLAVWLIGLIVVLVLAGAGAVFGAQYNVLQQLNLPRIPIDEGTATTAGVVSLVAILLVTLLGAVLGGKLGDRYHRRVDRAGFDV